MQIWMAYLFSKLEARLVSEVVRVTVLLCFTCLTLSWGVIATGRNPIVFCITCGLDHCGLVCVYTTNVCWWWLCSLVDLMCVAVGLDVGSGVCCLCAAVKVVVCMRDCGQVLIKISPAYFRCVDVWGTFWFGDKVVYPVLSDYLDGIGELWGVLSAVFAVSALWNHLDTCPDDLFTIPVFKKYKFIYKF